MVVVSQDSWQMFYATSTDLADFWGVLLRLRCASGGMGSIFVALGELNVVVGRLLRLTIARPQEATARAGSTLVAALVHDDV